MDLWRTHRADTGVSLRPDGITVVRVTRRWRRPSAIRAVEERPIRSGLLRPSSTDANVAQVDELARDLAAAARSVRAKTVAVSLPDGCASMAILPFDSLPDGERERETVVRWRFKRDRQCELTDEQLVYRMFPAPDRAGCPGVAAEGETKTAFVLAAAVKRPILQQYYRACEQAGLFPVSIGLAPLQLFDLIRRCGEPASESYWALRMTDRLIFVASRRGVPVFLRGSRVKETDVRAALLSSLQSFDDDCPHGNGPDGAAPAVLHVMGDGAQTRQGEAWDREVWTPIGSPQWQVEIRDGWPPLCWAWPSDSMTSIGRWCALAGLEAG